MRTTTREWFLRMVVVPVAVACALELAIGTRPSLGEGKAESPADVRITKFHLVETKDGKTVWEVWGDRGEVFEKTEMARVTKISNPVTVMLYSEQGKLTVRSDNATVNMRTKDIHMEHNVTATSEQGNSLTTQALNWSARDHRVSTRLPVTLVRGGLTSVGVGMEAETDLERVRFLSRVRSQVMPGSVGQKDTQRSGARNGGTQ